MSKNISNLLDSAGNAHANQLAQTRGLVSKWEKTGLLEGIGAEYDKSGMAVLLENQARQLIDEASSTSNGTANKEQWSGVALPLVRRVFGEIAAKDFVSVQPMNLPSGLVFFLDFKYGDTLENATGYPTPFVQGNDIMGNTSGSNLEAAGGLYGAGKFGYSLAPGNVAVAADTEASASWQDVGFNADLSASIAGGLIKKLTYNAGTITDGTHEVDTTAAGAIFVSNSRVLYSNDSDPNTQFADATLGEYAYESDGGVVIFVRVTALDNAVIGSANVLFPKATTADNRADFEFTGDPDGTLAAQDIEIPQVDVELRSEAIVAKTRKLKAAWSPEFAQDLNAYHSIDAEAELTSMLSEYISMEIDLEILDMLLTGANTTDYWSAALGEVYDSANSNFAAPTAAEAYTQFSWFQTLGTKIQKVSNKIHQKTLRGGANFIVCGPDIATIIESIPGYSSDTDGNQMSFAMGVKKTGALANRFTVYKNPYMKENTILLGFRGNQFLETGAVYAPYIPLIMTPLVYDPTNFTPRKGVMTRYAKKMVRPEFYGKIYVAGLDRV
jgi:hypothetical protein